MTTTNEKAARPCQGEAAQKTNLEADITPNKPLLGWFDLTATAKDSRTKRSQKRSWKRDRK